MIVLLFISGVFFGLTAAIFTLLSSGSYLLALLAYSGFGAAGAIGTAVVVLAYKSIERRNVTREAKLAS